MACYKLIEPQLYIVKDECLKKASEPKALSKWSSEALKSKHCLSDSEFGCFSFVPNIYSFCFKPRFLFLFINEKENGNYATIGGFKDFANTCGGSMATGFATGGIGAVITGGDFWTGACVGAGITGGDIWQGAAVGCLVALANFSLHKAFQGSSDYSADDDGGGKKPKGHDFTKRLTKVTATLKQGTRDITPGKPYDSRAFFDRMETFGSYTEATGLAYSLITGGTSLTLSLTGAGVGIIGTIGNAYMDAGEGNYGSAIYRILKFGATLGLGKIIESASYGSKASEFILKGSVEANTRAYEHNYNKIKH